MNYELYTDIGDRENNEDNLGFLNIDDCHVFAVADGLGGHGKGEIASNIAISTLVENVASNTNLTTSAILSIGFQAAQKNVMSFLKNEINKNAVKTTMVCALIKKGKLNIAHIGDSRCYVFRKGKILYQTKDHSVCQMLVNAKRISEDEIRNHPDRNRVLRVIGTDWDGEMEYEIMKNEILLRKGDAILLCTDGFWEAIDEKQMIYFLKQSNNAKEWMKSMIDFAYSKKIENRDNNTAICVQVE